MRDYLKNLVSECNLGKLKCLDYHCQNVISAEMAKKALDEQTYIKFIRFRKAIEVDLNQDLLRCPSCEELLNKKQLSKQKLANGNWACSECRHEICRKCMLSAHAGAKCPSENDSAFKLWAVGSAGVKNCPKCGARTQKSDGCNHMTCHRCRANWCWICGQLINELHYEPTRIFTGCPSLQFFDGSTWKLVLLMVLAFIFNPLVFALGPPIVMLGYSFYYAAIITERCLRNLRPRNCFACIGVSLLSVLVFLLLFSVIASFLIAFGCAAAALLVGIVSPLLMLYIIYFGLRLFILNCKTFK